MELLAKLFDEKILSILKSLQGKDKVQVREAARESRLPPSTVHRIFKKLESIGLLRKEHIGTHSIYAVLKETELYKLTEKIIPKKTPLEMFMDRVRGLPIEEILLMNSSDTMANLLIIGDVKVGTVQEMADSLKKDYGFSIRLLVLSRGQYENLDALNMKPSHQQVLFKKGIDQ